MARPTPTPVLPENKAAELRRIAQRYGVGNIRVFGSYARGEARPESDLDLLVDFETGRGGFRFMAFEREASEALGIRVDAHTEGGLSPYIRDRILREAVPL